MISSLAWIPRGAAKAVPDRAEIPEEELEAMKAAADAQATSGDEDESDSEPDSSEDASDSGSEMDEEAAVAKAKAFAAVVKNSSSAKTTRSGREGGLADAMAELDMDHYDDEDDGDAGASGGLTRILGAGNPGMAYHRNPREDPYLQKAAPGDADTDEDSDSEAGDLHLSASDLLIMAARNEDDVSHLEVWLYEEPDERGGGNLYVHHAIMLSAFPLAVAWMDCDPRGAARGPGNFAAVGSFEPGIEIWDLDVLDAVEPVAMLGGADYEAARAAAEAEAAEEQAGGSGKKGKKKKKKKGGAPEVPVRPGSHADAVLGLAWNREYRNVLASASADKSVKVWDVSTKQVSHTLTHHTDKVQAVAWNPAEAPMLLSGGFDRQACLADVRTPGAAALRWEAPADVEALAWDPHSPTCFAVAAENGEVLFYDARGGAGSAPTVRLAAHERAATSLNYSPAVPGLFLTASTDKKVKLWGAGDGGAPTLLGSEDLKVGAVFSACFCRDAPMVVAAGGAKGTVSVWDTRNTAAVVEYAKQAGQGELVE